MSLPISMSIRAEADLTHHYQWYFEKAGLVVAERFLEEFDATVDLLVQHSGLGRSRRFRAVELAGIRSFPVGGSFRVYLIFYRSGEGILRVERIMHGARDLPRRLLEPLED